MRTKSILIVGGGVIGLSTAYYAMLKGHRVVVLEREKAPLEGCSLGNAGMIVPSHIIPLAAPGMVSLGLRMMLHPESPFYIRPRLSVDLLRWGWLFVRSANANHVTRSAPLLRDLNLGSRACYEEMAERFGDDFGLVKKGLLMLCRSKHTLHEEAALAERARHLGIPAEVLSPEETATLDPGVKMDVAGSVYFPKDCHFSPQRFIQRLTQELISGGVTICYETDVRGWRRGYGKIEAALTNDGEFTADEYVLAGGSWSPETLHELELRLPMQAGKGYSITVPQPRQLPNLCSILTEARVAITPMGSSLRIGGTMEITGLDRSVSEARIEGIRKAVPQYFPNFTAEELRGIPVWSGLRPCSPDGMPYVGRFVRYTNLSTATGHAMMGMSLGPITGKLMAELLSGETPSINLSALRPDRYS